MKGSIVKSEPTLKPQSKLKIIYNGGIERRKQVLFYYCGNHEVNYESNPFHACEDVIIISMINITIAQYQSFVDPSICRADEGKKLLTFATLRKPMLRSLFFVFFFLL